MVNPISNLNSRSSQTINSGLNSPILENIEQSNPLKKNPIGKYALKDENPHPDSPQNVDDKISKLSRLLRHD